MDLSPGGSIRAVRFDSTVGQAPMMGTLGLDFKLAVGPSSVVF